MAVRLRESIARTTRLPRSDDLLMGRAQLLREDDRIIIETVLIASQSARKVSRLMGRSAKAVRDRVHRLSRRMSSRAFLDTARALAYLSPDDATLARARFCEGLSQRQMCARFGLTWHQLRRQLDLVAGQITSIRRQQRRTAGEGDDGQMAVENLLNQILPRRRPARPAADRYEVA